jgi:hypothetical protein
VLIAIVDRRAAPVLYVIIPLVFVWPTRLEQRTFDHATLGA